MIQPTNNLVVLGTKEFDAYWLKNLIINAPGLTDKAIIIANLVPYNSKTGEIFYEKETQLTIDDVLTLATTDSSLANTCNVIFNEIQRQAQMRGII